MRVNIYGEETTTKVQIVKKAVNQKTFVGVRFYLKSHPDLHHSEFDNDESGVTFWTRYTQAGGNHTIELAKILQQACDLLLQEK
jgi:hypothetical protein